MNVITAKLQDRGYITVPQMVREKLRLKRGETLAFIIQDNGKIEIEKMVVANSAVERDEFFEETGIPFDEWKASDKDMRQQLLQERYPEFAKMLEARKAAANV